MAQETRTRDVSIDAKMRELSNIYKMYCTTEGEVKAMWCNKWYQMVKNIATIIRLN